MADKGVSSSVIQDIICTATGIEREELTIPRLRKINDDLGTALEFAKKMKDPNIFIDKWDEFEAFNSHLERKNDLEQRRYSHVKANIVRDLTNISQRYIGGEKYCEGYNVVNICEGYITTGTCDGGEFSYYTKDAESGVDALIGFITKSVINEHPEIDDELDEFIEDTLSYKQEKYVYECKKGSQKWLKEVLNGECV